MASYHSTSVSRKILFPFKFLRRESLVDGRLLLSTTLKSQGSRSIASVQEKASPNVNCFCSGVKRHHQPAYSVKLVWLVHVITITSYYTLIQMQTYPLLVLVEEPHLAILQVPNLHKKLPYHS